MRKHATEHEHKPTRALCGKAVDEVQIDNCDPTCGSCRRVIRSRCSRHNVARCKVCPRSQNIGA